MLLHLIVAAALLAPCQSAATTARQTAAMVCSLAIDAQLTPAGATTHPAPALQPACAARPVLPLAAVLLTSQLRQ